MFVCGDNNVVCTPMVVAAAHIRGEPVICFSMRIGKETYVYIYIYIYTYIYIYISKCVYYIYIHIYNATYMYIYR